MTAIGSASAFRRYGRYFVGVLGILLVVDALLAYALAIGAMLIGGVPNPYIGIILVFVLPPVLALGVAMLGWGTRSPRDVAPEEAVHEAAVQGR